MDKPFDANPYFQRYGRLKEERSSWLTQWREVSQYLLPTTGRFLTSDTNRGNRRFNKIYDSTGTYCLGVLASGLMAGVTSPARPWFRLTTRDPELDEAQGVKEWLSEVTTIMQMVFARSNTYRMLPLVYEELSVYGTSAAVLLPSAERVIHSYPLTIGEYALACDSEGQVNTLYREFMLTAAQIVEQFGYDAASRNVQIAYDRPGSRDQWFPVLHTIEPRPELVRDPKKRDARNMPYRSLYFEVGARNLLRESGFRDFPALCPRWRALNGDVYGHSPAMAALGDLKQLQHQQYQKSKAIDYQTNPPLQVPVELKGQESKLVPGGVSYVNMSNPNAGVRTAFDVRLDLSVLLNDIMDIRNRVRATFFTDVFLMLTDRDGQPLTATEVAARHEEKIMVLGPVLENLQHELLEPLVDQTFMRMIEAGITPPPPRELQGMDLNVEFVSMLAQAQRAIATNSIDRYTMGIGAIAQMKPDVLDKFDADRWADIYSDDLGIDPRLIVPSQRVALIRQERAQQQAQQQQMASMQQAADTAGTLGRIPTSQPNALSDAVSAFSGL